MEMDLITKGSKNKMRLYTIFEGEKFRLQRCQIGITESGDSVSSDGVG
jgi:hypothetical protein